ncbi:phytanoyl-CoA dioxygenase family protein [Saccharata proteae CBS 121410]|uniref:Phytanoyl-CoA dioxygenase family protein n=1 Tax=Saccharata proteae CBS 121410 TaxID=1314787 RepID=A0A9P4HUH4_9PEZI|nr:phytanoyl-CoA dioxygenase family protein [Saccharata proteae CBS 121410]
MTTTTTTTTTNHQPALSPTSIRASLARDGFVLIPSILSPAALSTLRAAATRTTALTRAGHWPYMRTLPKQFPPWPSDPTLGIWGVQHLLHPSLPDASLFASSYFSAGIMDIVKALLECGDDDLVMELYNLLVRPDADFSLRWHRDDVSAEASREEEEERLARPAFHAQWNLALFDDRSLVVVPGSHARARTEAERGTGPFEEGMPGAQVVEMRAGDCVFYDNNILHRGGYSAEVERATLHGSVGMVGHGKERARNVLQHGIGAYVEKCDFSGLDAETRRRAEGMRERAVRMGREEGEAGFFSKDE